MVVSPYEKSVSLGPYTETSAPSKSSASFPVFSPFVNAYSRLSGWRAALGLPNPGTVENLQKEVKSEFLLFAKSVRGVSLGDTATHLTNFIFDGARADLMKGLSMDPAFQVTHSFQLASQSAPPTYSFGALFANPKVGYRMATRDLSYFIYQ
jgi:mitochondrial import receptor subunit TOM40